MKGLRNFGSVGNGLAGRGAVDMDKRGGGVLGAPTPGTVWDTGQPGQAAALFSKGWVVGRTKDFQGLSLRVSCC